MSRVDEIALHTRRRTPEVARFERIWGAHYAAVHAHAARRVGARADEVCAEVFLAAWRRLDELPADELPWLYAASRNVIGTLWRGEDRRERLQDRLEQEPTTETDADPGGLDPALAGSLRRLAEVDRELLLLVYWEGLTPSRAAKALGLTSTGARTRLWRARRKLQDALSEEDAR
jgi:RNA polymerase sigma-70 factor, ECF subfamily